MNTEKSQQIPFLNYQELSAIIKISPNTLRRWVMERRIPFFKVNGKAVRFHPDKIQQWLEAQSVEVGGK